MKNISTRGDCTERRFSEILLVCLAPDGGLYLNMATTAGLRIEMHVREAEHHCKSATAAA